MKSRIPKIVITFEKNRVFVYHQQRPHIRALVVNNNGAIELKPDLDEFRKVDEKLVKKLIKKMHTWYLAYRKLDGALQIP